MHLRKLNVVDVAIGPGYLGFLLSDGRICRTSYSINAERLATSTSTSSGTTSSRKRDARRRLNADHGSTGGSGATGTGVGGMSTNFDFF